MNCLLSELCEETQLGDVGRASACHQQDLGMIGGQVSRTLTTKAIRKCVEISLMVTAPPLWERTVEGLPHSIFRRWSHAVVAVKL